MNAVISLKKLNDKAFVVNCELIQSIECMPDTIISLTTGDKLIVKDSAREIVRKVIDYKRAINGRELEVSAGEFEPEVAKLTEG